MSLDIGIDPNTTSLLTAIGVTDDDGELVAEWFDHPLDSIGRILSDPAQRAALLRLLDELLPPDPSQPGWHPLLDTDAGNLYLTVDGDTLGVAASLRGDPIGSGVGRVTGAVRLPLVSAAGQVEAIAATADGPLSIEVHVGFTDPAIPLTGVAAAVTVYLDDAAPLGVQAGVRVRVEGFNLGGGDPVDLVVDSATIGADLVGVLRALLREVVDLLVAEAGGNEQLARLADHFFELLGIGDAASAIPPIPFEELFRRPEAIFDWLVDIVDTPATLTAWATHLAGLIGDDLGITGTGTPDDPFRATLLDSSVVDLVLQVTVTANRELEIGLDVRVDTGSVALSGVVTVLRIPLPAVAGVPADPAASLRRTAVVPEARVALIAPPAGTLIDTTALHVDQIGAGFRLADGAIQPWLSVTEVHIDGDDHGTVDLTDADAVIGVVADTALGVFEDAFGDSPAARALLTLVGLRVPDTDPTSPHRLDAASLGRGPTAALGGLHRAILADRAHPWSHMLGQVATLVGLTPAVTGAGTAVDPWVTPIATAGPASLSLAAWNARTDADPAGYARLRLGVVANAGRTVFAGRLLVELLAIDLPPAGAGAVSLVGRSELAIVLTPDGPLDLSGLAIASGPARAVAAWRPGEPPTWQVAVEDVSLTVGGEALGPFRLALPSAQADLGLGADAVRVLGQLLSSALRSWGGEPAYVLTALLGLHRDLPGLPDDWPLLADVLTGADGLQRFLADPASALRAYISRLLTGVAADGSAFAEEFLQTLGRLLPSDSPPGLGLPALRSITGSGRYDDPWVIPIVDESGVAGGATTGATRVDGLVWLEPGGPPAEWIAAIAQLADGATDGVSFTGFLGRAAGFRPQLASLLGGRNLDTLARGVDELTGWLGAGDGLVPLASQLPAGWAHGTTVATTHALLPRDPAATPRSSSASRPGRAPCCWSLPRSPTTRSSTTWSRRSPAGRATPVGTWTCGPCPTRSTSTSPSSRTRSRCTPSTCSPGTPSVRPTNCGASWSGSARSPAPRCGCSATRPPGWWPAPWPPATPSWSIPSSRSAPPTPGPTCARCSTRRSPTPCASSARSASRSPTPPSAAPSRGSPGCSTAPGTPTSAPRSDRAGSPASPTDWWTPCPGSPSGRSSVATSSACCPAPRSPAWPPARRRSTSRGGCGWNWTPRRRRRTRPAPPARSP